MKICLLGEFSGDLDEGMRKISFHLCRELSKRHEVLPLDLRNFEFRYFWNAIRRFKPQILHYIHGSTVRSFILLKTLSLCSSGSETVMSLLKPQFSTKSKFLLLPMRPNLLLAQSKEIEEIFKDIGFIVRFFPLSGVDIVKFNSEMKRNKQELRTKYGVDQEKLVVLHVGSIKDARGLRQFLNIQKSDENQVLIAGSISQGVEPEILVSLKRSGCAVLTQYIENIEEIYALSDCYVFPVMAGRNLFGKNAASSIEVPLSVLEAMACNLPVITTRFGGLSTLFEEGDGLIFVESEEEIADKVEEVRSLKNIKTREKALPYLWSNLATKLEKVYAELIKV